MRTTNFPLPVPWPWLTTGAQVGLAYETAGLAIGLGFIVITVAPVLGVVRAFHLRRHGATLRDVSLVALAVGVPYSHYAFSRADLVHLSVSITPLLILTCAWAVSLRPRGAAAAWIGLLVFGTLASGIPSYYNSTFLRPVRTDVGAGELIYTSPNVAETIVELRKASVCSRASDCGFLTVPGMKTYHAIMRQQVAMRDLINAVGRTDSGRDDELRRFKVASPAIVFLDREHGSPQWGSFCAIYANICIWLEQNYSVRQWKYISKPLN